MFKTTAIICFFCCAAAQAEVEPLPTPPRKSLVQQLFGKPAWIRSGVSSSWTFIRKTPHEWPRTTGGFATRYASSFGRHLVKGTVQYGIAAVRKEDLAYYRSEDTGFGRRLRHALLSTVVARKRTTGRPTMAVSRVTGVFTGGFVSRLWHPARLHTISSGLSTSGVSFGIDAGTNVVREFWPRRRRPAASAEGNE